VIKNPVIKHIATIIEKAIKLAKLVFISKLNLKISEIGEMKPSIKSKINLKTKIKIPIGSKTVIPPIRVRVKKDLIRDSICIKTSCYIFNYINIISKKFKK
jgi:hypothetical protein